MKKKLKATGNRKRIAIFTTGDPVWELPNWKRCIPILQEKNDVVGIGFFPDKLVKLKGIKKSLWYPKVFGIYSTILFALYALKSKRTTAGSKIKSWRHLKIKHRLKTFHAKTPNSANVCEWIKENKIDIILISLPYILKEKIINSPSIGIINKHAGMLPANKGIFPPFWAKLTRTPTGISFHQVDLGIDTGKLLVQLQHPPKYSIKNISMLRFYIDVFHVYPKMISLAVDRLIKNEWSLPLLNVESSYGGLPEKKDGKRYRKKAKIAQLSDLFYSAKFSTERCEFSPAIKNKRVDT